MKIKSVTEEMVGQGADQDQKLVVWFTNSNKGLALNKTNNRTIRGAYGDDVTGWAGKLIVLFPTQAAFRGGMVGALRVRIPLKKDPNITTGKLKPMAEAEEEVSEPDQPDFDDEVPF